MTQNCLSIRLSHTQLRSSLMKSHSFFSLPADTTMASSQGTSVSSNPFSRWTSHDIFLFKYHFLLTFYAFFPSFRITLWPMWLANSKRQPCFYPPQSHAQEDTQNWQKSDKLVGKPVLCQRIFSSVFRAVFLHRYTEHFILGFQGPFRVYGAL